LPGLNFWPLVDHVDREVFMRLGIIGLGRSLAALLLLGLIGCSKVTPASYAKIQVGMTRASLQEILGQPSDERSAGTDIGIVGVTGKMLTWKASDRQISVVLVNDMVVLKSQVGLP
jgi:hypothetical protein